MKLTTNPTIRLQAVTAASDIGSNSGSVILGPGVVTESLFLWSLVCMVGPITLITWDTGRNKCLPTVECSEQRLAWSTSFQLTVIIRAVKMITLSLASVSSGLDCLISQGPPSPASSDSLASFLFRGFFIRFLQLTHLFPSLSPLSSPP